MIRYGIFFGVYLPSSRPFCLSSGLCTNRLKQRIRRLVIRRGLSIGFFCSQGALTCMPTSLGCIPEKWEAYTVLLTFYCFWQFYGSLRKKNNNNHAPHPQNPCHHSPVPCGGEITHKKPSCSLGFLLGCSIVRPGLHPTLASVFLSPCKRCFILGWHSEKIGT